LVIETNAVARGMHRLMDSVPRGIATRHTNTNKLSLIYLTGRVEELERTQAKSRERK